MQKRKIFKEKIFEKKGYVHAQPESGKKNFKTKKKTLKKESDDDMIVLIPCTNVFNV